jgi:hypothetical protein
MEWKGLQQAITKFSPHTPLIPTLSIFVFVLSQARVARLRIVFVRAVEAAA